MNQHLFYTIVTSMLLTFLAKATFLLAQSDKPLEGISAASAPSSKFAPFHSITSKEGLSSDFVYSFIEDHQGFIWIGTEKGLNRFDGDNFTVFEHDPELANSLQGNFVWSLYEDSQDHLWVGTEYLHRLNRNTGTFEIISLQEDSLTSNGEIKCILEDKRGHFWIGTSEQGLKRLSPIEISKGDMTFVDWHIQHFYHEPDNPNSIPTNIRQFLLDKKGYLWVGGTGLSKINTQTLEVERIKTMPEQETKLQELSIMGLLEMDGKIIYATRRNGLYYEDGKKISIPQSIKKSWIKCLSRADEKAIWIGTQEGLHLMNLEDGKITSFQNNPNQAGSLPFNDIHTLFQDSQDNLWIGATGGGVILLPNIHLPFNNYAHSASDNTSISNNQVRSMLIDQAGFLWVAMLEGGLNKMVWEDKKGWTKIQSWQHEPIRPKGLPHNNIIQILQSHSGQIWVAMLQKGLGLLNPTTGELKFFSTPTDSTFQYNEIWALCEADKQHLWIGTFETEKVYRLNIQTEQIEDYTDAISLSGQDLGNVTNIYKDQSGHLWICTIEGLIQYHPSNGETRHFFHDKHDPSSISDNVVWTVLEDSEGSIWIGTNTGLNRFDPNSNQIERFYEKDGLPSNIVYGLLEDDLGQIWVSTEDGLARWSNGFFRIYNRKDGIAGNTFLPHSYHKDERSGQLFFGGLHGLTTLQPKDLQADTSQPTMILSALSVASPSKESRSKHTDYFIADKKKISLHHLDDILTFTFSDLNFQEAGNRFEYSLSGLSEQWIPLEEDKTMTFIDLKPGDYTLKMRGRKPDGILIQEQSLLEITVLPPWWQSWWAWLMYLLLLVGLVWQIYRFQLARQLDKQESRRLKELDQFKSRLYTNITHEFRTPLTVISGVTEQINTDETNKAIIQRNCLQLLSLVNQMLDLRKLETGKLSLNWQQGDIIKFLRYLTESLHSYGEMKEITIHFLSEEKSLLMDYDPEKITRIHSNLLSNAIKFTPKGGHVYILIKVIKKETAPQLIWEVRDTGIGIAKEKLPHIFDRFYQVDDSATRKGEGTGIGLTLVAELTKAMKGEVNASSVLGKGSTFTIRLPINNQAEIVEDSRPTAPVLPSITPTTKSLKTAVETEKTKQEKPVILIIEDNADVIHYLAQCLKEFYQITMALNGQEGIEKAIESIPNIVVSDVMMPEKDGFEVCQTLKTDERTSHIPIVLLTAKADIESRLEGLQRGADAYLSKPFHKEELLIILQNQLELRQKLQARYAQASDAFKASDTLPESLNENIDLQIEDAFLQKIRNLVEKDLTNSDIGNPQLMQHLRMSRSQIYKKVKALTGHSPSVYIRSIRLHHARKLLQEGHLNVSEVCYEVGFTSPAYFSNIYLEEFGVRPNEMLK